MIAGAELETAVRQAMARERVPSVRELARLSGLRPDTIYGWFNQPVAHVSAGSVAKLVRALGAKPGDPWHVEPPVKTLDEETLALLDQWMEKAFGQFEERLFRRLDERLDSDPRSGA